MNFSMTCRAGIKLALPLLVIFGISATSLGDIVNITASKDNTLYETTAGDLSNGAGEFMFAGSTSSGAIRRGLLAFDLSAIPAGSTIDSVALTLFMSRTISGNETVNLHAATSDWGEGTSDAPGQEGGGTAATAGDATWLNTFFATDFWNTAGGDFNAVASASQTIGGVASYTWETNGMMVNDVQSWLDNPGSNFGWVLIGNESTLSTAKQFFSRNNSDVQLRPMLTVSFTAVPEPTTGVVLCVLGVAATFVRRRSA